jgi:hypothetical protein
MKAVQEEIERDDGKEENRGRNKIRWLMENGVEDWGDEDKIEWKEERNETRVMKVTNNLLDNNITFMK